jgi:hypothetical protein
MNVLYMSKYKQIKFHVRCDTYEWNNEYSLVMMLTLCVYKYIFVVENELRELHQRTISISILTEDEASGFFL